MNDTSAVFGQHLRSIRKTKKLTQRDLATSIGLDHTYISKIEHGTMPPPSEVALWRLARVLETDAGELFDLAGKVPAHSLKEALTNPLLVNLIRKLCEQSLPDEIYCAMIALASIAEGEGNHAVE